ncbi:MAG: hypothetical protein AB1847_19675 [bacterium]
MEESRQAASKQPAVTIEQSVKKHKHRLMRQRILEILKSENPNAVDGKVIWFALDDLGMTATEQEVGAELKYLEDRGYIRKAEVGGPSLGALIYNITAEGIDLLDGILTNGGVAW